MNPPTDDQIKEWALTHICNTHGLDRNSPIIEECLLMTRAHFILGIKKTIEYYESQRGALLIAENPNAPIQKIHMAEIRLKQK